MNKKKKLKKKENKFKGIHDNNTAITVMKHLCVAIIFDKYFYINLYIYLFTSSIKIEEFQNFEVFYRIIRKFQNIMSNAQGILNIFENIYFGINKRGGTDLTIVFMKNFNEILVGIFIHSKATFIETGV